MYHVSKNGKLTAIHKRSRSSRRRTIVWTHFYSGSIALEALCSVLSLTINSVLIFYSRKMICRDQASERRYFGSRNIVFWRAKPCRGDILLTNLGGMLSLRYNYSSKRCHGKKMSPRWGYVFFSIFLLLPKYHPYRVAP
jgi:hypothetical protein